MLASRSAKDEEVEATNGDLEAMREELFLAVEAKRIASNRLEDMRQELEATQRRCERDSYASMEGQRSTAAQSGLSAAEAQKNEEKMRNAVEERNVLQHTLEWKEVQWKSKMEHLELEYNELKRRQHDEVARIKKGGDDTTAEFKRKVDALEQEKAFLAHNSNGTSSDASGASDSAAGGVGWLGLLRCPTRLADSGSLSSGGSGVMHATHCREVSWQLLGILPSTIALLCEVPGLKVIDITVGARTTWGEALQGSLVVSLLSSPQSAAWLRRAIVTHQNLASLDGSPGDVPGFAVHTLGQLEFRDGGGVPFESSVTVAHLPSEPRLGKAATVIVVVEPLAKPPKPVRPQGGRRSAVGGTREGSAIMSTVGGASVVSDNIQPSDSASNIAMRY